MPPWELMASLTPKAPKRQEAQKIVPLVWWRVKLQGDRVIAERDICMRTEDARDVAQYVAQSYPMAECVGIRRMKRAPR